MTTAAPTPDYGYGHDAGSHTHAYLSRHVIAALRQAGARTVLDLGCGNGSFTRALIREGFDAYGCDASPSGIARASQLHPDRFRVASAYDDLRDVFGERRIYDAIVSVEVVEHLYAPRTFAARAHEALRPRGTFVLTTPYHGYLKNVALALSGKLDAHFTALWEGGHIKFWSPQSLSELLRREGFVDMRYSGAGRFPFLWKSMVMVARRPA